MTISDPSTTAPPPQHPPQQSITSSIRATYWIGTEPNIVTETRLFDSSNTEPAIHGLPPGTIAHKPNPGEYSYSGMQDGGLMLPPLHEGGDMAVLLGCVSKAKQFSDTYLTQIIEDDKKLIMRSSSLESRKQNQHNHSYQSTSSSSPPLQETKKPKTDPSLR